MPGDYTLLCTFKAATLLRSGGGSIDISVSGGGSVGGGFWVSLLEAEKV